MGCSGAYWQRVEIDEPYVVPTALTIAIVARPEMADARAAFSAALLEDLASHGIRTAVIPASRNPDVTLSIVEWDSGSRGLRWFISFGAGKGHTLVTVDSMAVNGVARGWVTGGSYGGSDANSAEAAGRMIAYTLATGLREPPAQREMQQ